MGNKRWRKPKISLKLMRKRKAQHAIASRIQKAQKNISDAVEPLSDSTSTIVIDTSAVAQHSSVDTEPCNLSTPVRFNESLCKTNDNISLSTESWPYKEKKFGRRIINVSQFFNHLQQISSHGPLDCGLQSVEIISETRVGLVSKFKLKCKMCRKTFLIQNDYPIDEMDLNTSAVAGAVVIGCGFSQLTQLSAAIGLVPMSKTIFGEKMEIVSKKWEDELLKSMAEAAEEERSLAIQEGSVNSNGIAIIDVIADGCYGKRFSLSSGSIFRHPRRKMSSFLRVEELILLHYFTVPQ